MIFSDFSTSPPYSVQLYTVEKCFPRHRPRPSFAVKNYPMNWKISLIVFRETDKSCLLPNRPNIFKRSSLTNKFCFTIIPKNYTRHREIDSFFISALWSANFATLYIHKNTFRQKPLLTDPWRFIVNLYSSHNGNDCLVSNIPLTIARKTSPIINDYSRSLYFKIVGLVCMYITLLCNVLSRWNFYLRSKWVL